VRRFNEEVVYEDTTREVQLLKYKIEGGRRLLILLTRREIFGDTAICINPNDERFAHLKVKTIVPVGQLVIPVEI
jgi:valyl-tRNA synthetase